MLHGNDIVNHYVNEINGWFNSWKAWSRKYKENGSKECFERMVKSEALMHDSLYEFELYRSVILEAKEKKSLTNK